jgi:hypothetical protein
MCVYVSKCSSAGTENEGPKGLHISRTGGISNFCFYFHGLGTVTCFYSQTMKVVGLCDGWLSQSQGICD